MPAKMCLDRGKRLFNGIEVRGIGGKEYQFALGLVFDQSANVFRMVYIAVVEYEDTSWPGVGVSEWDNKLLKELKETL
jgi:hypothetical protein